MKSATIWSVFFLAAVSAGGLWLVGWWAFAPDDPASAQKGEPILSPDRSFKAVKILEEGGGGISPHCYESVSVMPTNAPFEDARADTAMVFGSQCDIFGFDAECRCMESSPKVEWISNRELKITFSINSTALHASSVKLRKLDASGSVRIMFVVRE